MENGILVSAIVPVYNVKPYLREALDSVLKQTYDKMEIIIVDDGSTDGSEDICDEYAKKDQRCRVIHQENKGLSGARNAALDLMTGDVVAFLDSDDAYHLDYIETMLSALLQQKADICVCQYTDHFAEGPMEFHDTDKLFPPWKAGLYDRIGALRALADNGFNVIVWNKLYRHELWKGIRFPEGHVHEDLDTTYKIFDQCKRVYVLRQALYMRRRHPGSITSTFTEQRIRDRLLAESHFNSFVLAHIPEVYSLHQLEDLKKTQFSASFLEYYRFTEVSENRKNPFATELRTWITNSFQENGVRGIRNRISYILLRLNPWLFRACLSMYIPFRRLSKKIIGR